MPTPMTTRKWLEASSCLEQAQQDLAHGEAPDMAKLEAEILELCDLVRKANIEEQQEELPRLEDLFVSLEKFTKAVNQTQRTS